MGLEKKSTSGGSGEEGLVGFGCSGEDGLVGLWSCLSEEDPVLDGLDSEVVVIGGCRH